MKWLARQEQICRVAAHATAMAAWIGISREGRYALSHSTIRAHGRQGLASVDGSHSKRRDQRADVPAVSHTPQRDHRLWTACTTLS